MMQYDNYDTDKTLKQMEDQSIPDLSKMNEHWEKMKMTLAPAVQPGKNGNILRRPGFYALAATITGLVLLVVLVFNKTKSEKEQEIIVKSPVIETRIDSGNVPVPSHTPVIQSTAPVQNIVAVPSPLPILPSPEHLGIQDSFDPGEKDIAPSPDYSAQLAGFFDQLKKPVQQFIINAKKDTVLFGKDGSALLIPANTFDKSSVTIVLKEFYSYQDMVANKLTTMSNGQQLITGGMIHITAIADGKEVKIKPNKSIRWFIPDTSAEMSQMQLFYGIGNGAMTAAKATYVEPLIPGSNVTISTTKTRLRNENVNSPGTPVDPAFDRAMWQFKDSVRGNNITMDLTNGADADNSIDGINWIPQRQFFTPNYFTTRVRVLDLRDIPIRTVTTKNGKRAIFRMSDNSVLGKEELEKRLMEKYSKYYSEIKVVERAGLTKANRSNRGSVVADGVGDSIWIDVTEAIRYRLEGKDTIRFGSSGLDRYADDNPLQGAYIASAKQLANRYSVDIRTLGWINCDKFYRYGLPQIPFRIDLQDRASNYYALLVFDKIRSVMTGAFAGNEVMFANVPEGMTAKVVVVGIKDGKSIMAIQNVTISRKKVTDLVFEEVSPDEYKEEVALLDK